MSVEYEARKLSAQSGIDIEVSNRVTAPIEPQLATAAFRIFQEAVTNSVRHSRATTITVGLETSARKRLVLSIQDNGVGMAGEQLRGEQCLGLTGMRERHAPSAATSGSRVGAGVAQAWP